MKYIGCNFGGVGMSPARTVMAMGDDTLDFILKNTALIDVILAMPKKERFFPKIGL